MYSSDNYQMPPANIEAEEAILGGIILDPNAIGRVEAMLKPEMFYISAHRDIYQACLQLYQTQQPTDLLSVTSWLTDYDLLLRIGGRNKLASLVDQTVSAVNIDAFAALVVNKYRRRRMLKAAQEIHALAFEPDREVDDLLNEAEAKLLAIRNDSLNSCHEPEHLADILTGVFNDVDDRCSGVTLSSIPSGFYDVDILTGGLRKGKLITVAGRPAMGKSSYLGNLARHVAGDFGGKVLLFSMEMSKQQWGVRFLSQEAKIESCFLTNGTVTNSQWSPLAAGIARLSDCDIYIDDTPNLTLSSLVSKVRRMTAHVGELAFVGIDYLQLIADVDSDGVNKTTSIGRITRTLKILARECNTTIVMLSQLSRNVEQRSDKRPIMSDLYESGKIEQDSDIVALLYRDEYYHPDTPDRGIAEVIIAKNRDGATGMVKLLFDAPLTQFKNLISDKAMHMTQPHDNNGNGLH
jgi:replicative DNA helicase